MPTNDPNTVTIPVQLSRRDLLLLMAALDNYSQELTNLATFGQQVELDVNESLGDALVGHALPGLAAGLASELDDIREWLLQAVLEVQ